MPPLGYKKDSAAAAPAATSSKAQGIAKAMAVKTMKSTAHAGKQTEAKARGRPTGAKNQPQEKGRGRPAGSSKQPKRLSLMSPEDFLKEIPELDNRLAAVTRVQATKVPYKDGGPGHDVMRLCQAIVYFQTDRYRAIVLGFEDRGKDSAKISQKASSEVQLRACKSLLGLMTLKHKKMAEGFVGIIRSRTYSGTPLVEALLLSVFEHGQKNEEWQDVAFSILNSIWPEEIYGPGIALQNFFVPDEAGRESKFNALKSKGVEANADDKLVSLWKVWQRRRYGVAEDGLDTQAYLSKLRGMTK